MESTNQRYATFLRQWKKRHNYSNFRNQYRKYERLPMSEGRKKPQSLISAHHEEMKFSTLHDSTKLQPAPQSFSVKQGKSSAAAIVSSSKFADFPHGQEGLSDIIKKFPNGLNRQRETKAQMITFHPPAEILQRTNRLGKIFTPTIEELPYVNSKSNTVLDPAVSPAELADMEFWLLYGESAQSTARHFSYALLARIDQLLEDPASSGRKSRLLKTTVQRNVIPTNLRETIQFKTHSECSCRLPEMYAHVTKQGNSMKPKKKENCVYWSHSSDCADRYRLHILKFIKKTNKTYDLGMKNATVDKPSQTSDDKCFEKLQAKDTKKKKRFNSRDFSEKNIQNGKASIFGDGSDCTPQEKINVVAPKISDMLLTNKVQLNASKNSSEMKLMKQMASASSLIAVASSASSKPGDAKPDSHACLPSAGSSVTVYLPRCPLDSGTTNSPHSSNREDAGRQEDILVKKRAGSQKKHRQHGKADYHKGVEFACESKSNNDFTEEDGDEKQDIISVSIRLHQKLRPRLPQANTSQSLEDKLQRLNSASGVDSRRKCDQWLNEKCPE